MKRILLAMAATLAVGSAAAQDYPNRAIRIITPAAQGGTTDILARLFGARMNNAWNVPVLVENRASNSGVLAGEMVAAAPPDGYTLLLAYHQHIVNGALNPKLSYHPVESFTPIVQMTTAGFMLVVHPSAPAKTLAEFMEWTRNSKGALNFGSAGNGSGGHLAGELFKQMTGVKAEHIPYKGNGPALMDLVAGQYHYNFAGILGAAQLARGGKLRGLAVTTPRRVASMPELPAMTEALPGFEVVGWYGLVGPAKLPKAVVDKLHAEVSKGLAVPEVRERILADGSEPASGSPEDFRKFLVADYAKWSDVVKKSGAKLD